MKYITKSPEETSRIGFELAKKLDTGGISRAYIAMRGEMGVGKTAFVRGFASYFGIEGVKSPTYAVMNQHTSQGGVKIYHFDMYRIESDDDLYSIGYDDYIESDGYALVEWSENIDYAIPSGAIFVTIERDSSDEGKRDITILGLEE